MITDGVIVWNAAYKNWKPDRTAEGKVERMYTKVLYDAMIIGGKGGKSGCAGGGGGSDVGR